ncbi:hypothetical protein [Pseudoalteromonas piscicida]
MTFNDLLFRAGFMNFGNINKKEASKYLHVTPRTLNRWIKDDNPCPRAVDLLKVRIDGIMCIREEWKDFSIDRESRLVTPRGAKYDASYINKIDFLQRSNHFHESRAAALEHQIKYLQDLVKASEQLKSMGNELINLSDRFKFQDAMLRYQNSKKDKLA